MNVLFNVLFMPIKLDNKINIVFNYTIIYSIVPVIVKMLQKCKVMNNVLITTTKHALVDKETKSAHGFLNLRHPFSINN